MVSKLLTQKQPTEKGCKCHPNITKFIKEEAREQAISEFKEKVRERIDKLITTNLQGIALSRCEGLWLAKDVIDKTAQEITE